MLRFPYVKIKKNISLIFITEDSNPAYHCSLPQHPQLAHHQPGCCYYESWSLKKEINSCCKIGEIGIHGTRCCK